MSLLPGEPRYRLIDCMELALIRSYHGHGDGDDGSGSVDGEEDNDAYVCTGVVYIDGHNTTRYAHSHAWIRAQLIDHIWISNDAGDDDAGGGDGGVLSLSSSAM